VVKDPFEDPRVTEFTQNPFRSPDVVEGAKQATAQAASSGLSFVTEPTFWTFDQASLHRQLLLSEDPKLDPHILEVIVSSEGKVLGRWWEVSGPGGLAGHTEQIALSRIPLRPGLDIEFRGGWGACNYTGGCADTLDFTAREFEVDITYRSPKWNAFYGAGEGHIPEFFAK
jgi:hypothetical protein